MLLEGLHLPLTTPFYADGRLNLRKLEENVAHYSLTPAAGLMVLGGASEAGLLSDAEMLEVLRVVARKAAPTKVLLAGVPRASVTGALALIESAAGLGYDVAVVGSPELVGIRAEEKRLYLEMVADRAKLPVLLGGVLPLELVTALAAQPNVLGWMHDLVGAKVHELFRQTAAVRRSVEVTTVFAAVTRRMETGGDENRLMPATSLSSGGGLVVAQPRIKTRSKIVGFQVLETRTERLFPSLEAGATGGVLPLSAAAPQACYEVYAAWKDGDQALAEEKQQRLVRAAGRMEGTLGVAALKYAAGLNGYAGGTPRLPLLPLTGTEQAEVAELMADLRA